MLPNINKRIMNKEINEIQTKYKSIQIHITHPNQFNIFLYDPFEDLLPKTLEFSIPKEYPFVPPQIFTRLNNKTPEDAPQEVQGQHRKYKIPYIKTIHCCEIPSVIKKLKKYYNKNLFTSECLYRQQSVMGGPSGASLQIVGDIRPSANSNVPFEFVECLNCSFITNHWSPALGTPNIITSIEKIQTIKRQIKYEIIMERFYKTDKLPIEMWDIIGTFLFTFTNK